RRSPRHMCAGWRWSGSPGERTRFPSRGWRDRSRGDGPEPREASLENPAHEAAGDGHVRIGQPVADPSPVTFGLDDPGAPKDGQVLGHVRLTGPDRLGQRADAYGSVREGVDDLEASSVRQRLEDIG